MDVDILILLSWLARHIYLSEDSGLIYFSIRWLKEKLVRQHRACFRFRMVFSDGMTSTSA